MQKKTINKIIKDKMKEWLDTLPKNLAEDVEVNLLVSGGSIASLFLKEPVNDFDIYIQDVDVLLKLAEYYTKPKNIICFEGRLREIYLEEKRQLCDLKEIFGSDESEHGIFLRNLHPEQIKLAVSASGESYEVKDIKENTYEVVFLSENAITLTNQIQIVLRFTGDHTEIHKNFDFKHATNYWTFYDGLVTNLEAVESLLTKQLFYQGSLYPLTSVIRMKKFILRGWKISAGEILKILYQTSKLNLDDPAVLQEQLIGVDIAYFSLLIKLLQAVPEQDRTQETLINLIDKIFNDIE